MGENPFLFSPSFTEAPAIKTRDRLGLVANQPPANPIQNFLSRKGSTFHGCDMQLVVYCQPGVEFFSLHASSTLLSSLHGERRFSAAEAVWGFGDCYRLGYFRGEALS